MSIQTTGLLNSQQAIVNTNRNKILLSDNKTQSETYTSGGSQVTLLAGTVMGRITGTNLVIPTVAAAVDGSQIPIGILADDYVIPATTTVQLLLCVYGEVARSEVRLQGADTLETVVATRRLKDHLLTTGIKLTNTTDLTNFDNQ